MIRINVIESGVGGITESDANAAATAQGHASSASTSVPTPARAA